MTENCCSPTRKTYSYKNGNPEINDFQPDGCFEKDGGFEKIPGGTAYLGTNTTVGYEADFERPQIETAVESFRISRYTVTNADFARFIKTTGYKTDAEKFGWSFVFYMLLSENEKQRVAQVVDNTPWWCVVEGAAWDRPFGRDSHIENMMNHPVVHVSWNDARAFCDWAGTRLPDETEWEHAARGGTKDTVYPWGNELEPGGEHRSNVWQGKFPAENLEEDGYSGTAPASEYKPNGYNLYNMTGNVWEWCGSNFENPLKRVEKKAGSTLKVLKGGSYLCHESYCNRYRIAARIGNTADSSAGNIGFRVVKK